MSENTQTTDDPLVEVRNLRTRYTTKRDGKTTHVDAVDGVSFDIRRGEIFGLVGESGCGKSTIAKSIMGILPRKGEVVGGDVRFKGNDLTGMSERDLRRTRWEEIAMISQSAMNALDPVYTVGQQMREAIDAHRDMSREKMDERIEELFRIMGIGADRIEDYPHQFSGGMKQRAMIAMALLLEPDFVIADEPTTALDLISQDGILYHLEELQRDLGTTMLLITHDMSVVSELCDRTAVMYAGKIAELGRTASIFGEPTHPYTMGLKNAFPSLLGHDEELIHIPGSPPQLVGLDEQCRFAERCPFVGPECWEKTPPLIQQAPDQEAACLRTEELGVEMMRAEAREKETWQVVKDHDPVERTGNY